MKNAMQFNAQIKKLAQEKNISAQLVLQNYMLERRLERIALSDYRQHWILKGAPCKISTEAKSNLSMLPIVRFLSLIGANL